MLSFNRFYKVFVICVWMAAFASSKPLFAGEVSNLLQAGYPASVVYLHGISKGMPLDEIVNEAISGEVDRADEFYQTARNLLPNLSASCGFADNNDTDGGGEYLRGDLTDMTVAAVAQRFFAKGERLARLENGNHLEVATSELSSLASGGKRWYSRLGGNSTGASVVFVSLFKDTGEISVDSNIVDLSTAPATLPVAFVYNYELDQPVGRYDGQPDQLKNVVDAFRNNDIKMATTPNWKFGDFLVDSTITEVENYVVVPAQADIDPTMWNQIRSDLQANGFTSPVRMTLLEDSPHSLMNETDRARLAAAKDLGIVNIPIALFYQRGVGSNTVGCDKLIRDAAVRGGGLLIPYPGSEGGVVIPDDDGIIIPPPPAPVISAPPPPSSTVAAPPSTTVTPHTY